MLNISDNFDLTFISFFYQFNYIYYFLFDMSFFFMLGTPVTWVHYRKLFLGLWKPCAFLYFCLSLFQKLFYHKNVINTRSSCSKTTLICIPFTLISRWLLTAISNIFIIELVAQIPLIIRGIYVTKIYIHKTLKKI